MKKAAVPSILVVVVLLAVASADRGAAAEEGSSDRVSTSAGMARMTPSVPRRFGQGLRALGY